jgi:hypothetical protein
LDKFEYKVRAEEIKSLIASGEYAQAAEIADMIDWRRVKSVMMLCTISDLYKINRRYEDARDMLLLAYDKHPGGRTIVYSLCELSIKMGEFVPAVEYYKEFVQIAPRDTGRYILQYKLYEAQDTGLEERIAVLEELKSKDYREKWAYELAYLYHRVGLGTRCVEECDEMITWFGEGKYVIKAMELKMLHQPLTPQQQTKYERRFGEKIDSFNAPTQKIPSEEMDIQVKPMDLGHYNTINMQKELAAGLKEVLDPPKPIASDTDTLDVLQVEEVDADGVEQEEMDHSEVFFGENEAQPPIFHPAKGDIRELRFVDDAADQAVTVPANGNIAVDDANHNAAAVLTNDNIAAEYANHNAATVPVNGNIAATSVNGNITANSVNGDISDTVMDQLRQEYTSPTTTLPPHMADVLSMESDGQIRLVLPEKERVEKQITGQISITDILAEWERMKKEQENRSKEEIRRHVLEQTGPMFTEFEASVRDGLLEKLEKEVGQEEPKADDQYHQSQFVTETYHQHKELQHEPQADSQYLEPQDATEMNEQYLETQDKPEADDLYLESEDNQEINEHYSETQDSPVVQTTGGVIRKVSAAVPNGTFTQVQKHKTTDSKEEKDFALLSLDADKKTRKTDAEKKEALGVGYETGGIQYEELEAVLEQVNAQMKREKKQSNGQETNNSLGDAQKLDQDNQNQDVQDRDNQDQDDQDQNDQNQDNQDFKDLDDGRVHIDHKGSSNSQADDSTPKQAHSSSRPRDVQVTDRVRNLTIEEKERYAPYVQSKAAREQLARALDAYQMEASRGNVIITGEEGMDTLSLAKSMIKQMQESETPLTGKAATISGASLNHKDIPTLLEQMMQGALIIKKASEMTEETVGTLQAALEQLNSGILIFIEDTKKAMDKFMDQNPILSDSFTARIDIATMSNDTLVAFGRKYAKEREYAIDEMGILALHTRIGDLQTSEHVVTVVEVKDIVDEAILNVKKKTIKHFFDILLAKRYDDNDMIILREKDFLAHKGR